MAIVTGEMIKAARKHDHDTRPRGNWGSVPESQVRRLLEGALAVHDADLSIKALTGMVAFMSPGRALMDGGEFLAELGKAMLGRLGAAPDGRASVSVEADDDVTQITITWGAPPPAGSGCKCYRGPRAHAHDSDEEGDCVLCGCGRHEEPEPAEGGDDGG